jgi:hypothetical protein
MPRFTPWYAGIPVDPADSVALLEEVLRPSLRQAFPLPEPDEGAADPFATVLDALAQPFMDKPEN